MTQHSEVEGWESSYDAMVEDAKIYGDFPDILAEHIKGYVRNLITTHSAKEREEEYRKLSPWLQHDATCYLYTGDGEPCECDCGLTKAVTTPQTDVTKN
jgi:hypothetical protein